jgi:hypothetical protein
LCVQLLWSAEDSELCRGECVFCAEMLRTTHDCVAGVCAQSLGNANDFLFGHWYIRGECVFSHSCPRTSANCDDASVCFDRRSCERSGIALRECVCSHRWTRMIVCPVTRVYGRSRIVSRRRRVLTGGAASEAGLRRGSVCSHQTMRGSALVRSRLLLERAPPGFCAT